jgi:hypothetical protein
LILKPLKKWRRRELNPRPKTFHRRVYILVRFQFCLVPVA